MVAATMFVAVIIVRAPAALPRLRPFRHYHQQRGLVRLQIVHPPRLGIINAFPVKDDASMGTAKPEELMFTLPTLPVQSPCS